MLLQLFVLSLSFFSFLASSLPLDLTVTNVVYLDIAIDPVPSPRPRPDLSSPLPLNVLGTIELGLFGNHAPKTVENFRALCTGETGPGFSGSEFHRIVQGFMIQGHAIGFEEGKGSIYGADFDDENLGVPPHHQPGTLSMANAGPNTNANHFFISNSFPGWLDGKHVIFGHVLSGMDVVRELDKIEVDGNDRPIYRVLITKSGERSVYPSLQLSELYFAVNQPALTLPNYLDLLLEEDQEGYDIYYGLARAELAQGNGKSPRFEKLLLKTIQFDKSSTRAEANYQLAKLYESTNVETSFKFAKAACDAPLPESWSSDHQKDIYLSARWDFLGVVAYYAKQYEDGAKALEYLIDAFPLESRYVDNLHYYRPQYIATTTHSPVDCSVKSERGDTISIHYKGFLENGTEFSSSYSSQPFTFTLGAGQAIKGADYSLLGRCVGEKIHVVMKPAFAYGRHGYGSTIPPNATLTFDYEVTDLTKPQEKETTEKVAEKAEEKK